MYTFHHYVWKLCPVTSGLGRKEKAAAYQALRTNQSRHSEIENAMFFSDSYLTKMGTNRRAFERMRAKTGMFDRIGSYSKEKGLCYPLAHNNVSRDVVVQYATDSQLETILNSKYEDKSVNFGNVKNLMNTSNDTRTVAESAKFLIGAQENNVLDVRYNQHDCGRKFATGEYTLQRTPTTIKRAAMTGWYDYDFQNCHVAVLSSMGDFPAFRYYYDNTEEVRCMLSTDCGVDTKTIKICLLSILYGAKANPYGTLHKKMKAAMDLFLQHPFVKDFIADCKKAQPILLQKAEEMGLKGKSKASICSKVLMTYESQMLDIATSDVLNCVLMFDGYLSTERCNVGELEKRIYEKMNIDIKVTEEQL